MTKKAKQTQKSLTFFKKHQYWVTAVIIVLVVLAGFGMQYCLHMNADAARKDKITAIYDSFKLSADYKLTHSDVFGDKRVYSWDAGRTYSSSKHFIRNATVKETSAELKSKIEAAGFTYFEEPYPGATFTELHFKSAKGEYVRMNVSSKPRDDVLMGNQTPTAAQISMDPNAAPSNVTLKVNLDDNNE